MTNGFYIPVVTSIAVCMKAYLSLENRQVPDEIKKECDFCEECEGCADSMKPVELDGERHFC